MRISDCVNVGRECIVEAAQIGSGVDIGDESIVVSVFKFYVGSIPLDSVFPLDHSIPAREQKSSVAVSYFHPFLLPPLSSMSLNG